VISRSVVVLVLYASLMTGLTAVVAQLGAAMARQTAGALLFAEKADQPVSRVERGLEVQARVTDWQPVGHVVELHAVPHSDASAVELASGMDTAEDADLPQAQPSPAPAVRALKPRVAGWIRRAPRMPKLSNATSASESTAQLIQRHLRAEM